ncbi:TRAP-type C4-dicarboxylate transport system, large permease component [Lunatimonas lonarensis]|uniref:TRAP-type C4-dicarboxylate transport system, large permease component n=1 Tax=Lunatimonas lonarensis TaxID=1232681 RepID=R7ZMD4_9BACT|nr:TRAP transporter large permease [Lunatimonas lonarensis]EON75263.1 TRAP-type C4-dicarboxylate transport system, large permease component [Lunatimonas lonarensis]
MALLLFAVFLLLLVLGVPIAFTLGISAFVYILFSDLPLMVIPQKMYAGLDVFVLLSIPGFILAGNLMNASGITDRIIRFCNALLGHVRGGLGLANVGASMLFGGISGTAIADTASIGSVMIPAMKKEGYDTAFSCAVTASSSTIGPVIPPSLPMIIAATLTGLSVGKLFVAGMLPGIVLGLGFMVVTYLLSVKRKYPKNSRMPMGQIAKSFFQAFWAIMMTLVILFGIIGGVFTPTEASIVAVIYAMAVGLFVYGELRIRAIPKIMLESAKTTAALMVLVGFANLFAWIMTVEELPRLIADTLLDLTDNKFILLLLINLLLLFVGAFMETIAALLILFPVLLGVAVQVGVDPVQFGVVMVFNLVIGLTTPPVGVCLFVASSIGQISLEKIAQAGLPFLLVSLIVLLLVTYIPAFSLWLPGLFYD